MTNDRPDATAPETAPETARGPSLTGRRVHLRPVHPSDYEYLYALATGEQTGFRWRYRGVSPSPESFAQGLWQQVIAQFVVERRSDGERLGHVVAFDANERNGFCHIGILLDPEVEGAGWAFEAAALFVEYLFTLWPFRKLYGEVLEFNYAAFESGRDRWFREEGRLRAHEYHDNRYWDLVLVALHREDWERDASPILRRLAALGHES